MDNTWIVAEIGINHNSSLKHMKSLIWEAHEAGADFIKFQIYFGKWPDMQRYEFTQRQWLDIFDTCAMRGIRWFATPFDEAAVDFCAEQNMTVWKVPSGMATNMAHLRRIHETPNVKAVFISTGMCTETEYMAAYKELRHGQREVLMLQCTTQYPTPYTDVNLDVLRYWNDMRLFEYGISDHTPGLEVPVAAVALGARIVEKHLTLDKTMDGPDHAASITPDEFTTMVTMIRHVESAMGSRENKPTQAELQIRDKIREKMA